MSEFDITYKKFPARHWKILSFDRIFFAADHLLLVLSNLGISEDYKRFYFKDIQAVNILKTPVFKAKIIISTLLMLICLAAVAGLAIISADVGFIILFFLPMPVILAYLIFSILKGPSCRFYIYTSVQKQAVSPINTIKKANRFLQQLVPQIEAIQGKLSEEQVVQVAQSSTPLEQEHKIASNVQEKPMKNISATWHWLLFLGVLGLSGLSISHILIRSPYIAILISLLYTMVFVFNIVATVKQVGSTLSFNLKTVTIFSLVLTIISMFLGYVVLVFFMIRDPDQWVSVAQNNWEMLKYFSQINLFEFPVLLWGNVILAAGFAILGISGVIMLWKKGA